jgi:hypothetical protein
VPPRQAQRSARRASFDDLVGLRQQQSRYGEAERFGGLQVNDKLIFVGACTGMSAGFSPLSMRST